MNSLIKTSKNLLRRILPERIILAYHYCLAQVAALAYGFPSHKMYLIGVTGTKGKTSTINFMWSVLNAGSYKTGIISTANIRIGEIETMNQYHMTMPGRFAIQRTMARMLKAGCTHCIIETTSEGVKLSRHIGIAYDCMVFTNLTPEHLPSHGGSFENYKKMKMEPFRRLSTLPYKNLLNPKTGKIERISKTIIANLDDGHAKDFLQFPADSKFAYGIKTDAQTDFQATNISESALGVTFDCRSDRETNQYKLSILGAFNIYNALPAIAFGHHVGITTKEIANGLTDLHLIPGRMEKIDRGQPFTVIVDYAHEKISMNYAMQTAKAMVGAGNKIIVNLGAEGGGRDKTKRKDMGEIVGRLADYVVVSNVDPYDDDPIAIIEDIARAAESAGKTRNKDLFTIPDRRSGIAKCLSLTKPGDVVIIACKGAEQSMIIGGESLPWDDRKVVSEEIDKLPKS